MPLLSSAQLTFCNQVRDRMPDCDGTHLTRVAPLELWGSTGLSLASPCAPRKKKHSDIQTITSLTHTSTRQGDEAPQMLSQWIHDLGTEASSAESVLPFARSGGSRPGHGGVAGGGAGNGAGGRDAGPACGGGLDLDPSSVVEAHRHATQAEELRQDGRLLEALQEHLEASHCFLEAAELLRNAHGVVRANYDHEGRGMCV